MDVVHHEEEARRADDESAGLVARDIIVRREDRLQR